MEAGKVKEQPYRSKIDFIKDEELFAVHGTVYNDKELARIHGADIKADTEIFRFISPPGWGAAKGTYVIIGITKNEVPYVKENGLKSWKYAMVKNGKYYGDVFSTGEIKELEPNHSYFDHLHSGYPYSSSRTLFAAFSSGMDISMSVYKQLSYHRYKKLVLNYFAWGSKAEEMEMLQLEKFKDFYSSEFPEVEVEVKIWEAEKYFSEYFELNGAPLPKISIFNLESEADSAETESPLSYVPYRNTQFAILLASKAEAMGLQSVDILFGLNLSEGMVFMDNSEGWLEAINQAVQLGGKDFKYTGSYKVVAPYFPRTKTNMLKEFRDDFGLVILENLLNLSKSCYYPNEDGSPCGKCGSCILREKALQKIKNL
jgi:7-cyano-7-deazaguanine synthase